MGLIVGIKKGTKFYIDDKEVEVLSVSGYRSATIKFQDKQYVIHDDKAVELMPNVFVYCGKPKDELIKSNEKKKSSSSTFVPDLVTRLVVDAPREIVILREKLYREQQGKAV